jgi:peroxiredoxin
MKRLTAAVALVLACGAAASLERPPAPEISLPDTDGRTVTLAEYRGRVVLLAFTRGAWCTAGLEQLLQLERLKGSALKGVAVLVVAPDPPEGSRALVASVEKQRRVRLTHRFLSAPRGRTLNRPAATSEGKAPRLPPSLVLVDRDGREAWRFVEREHRMRPSDRELARAVAKTLGAPGGGARE